MIITLMTRWYKMNSYFKNSPSLELLTCPELCILYLKGIFSRFFFLLEIFRFHSFCSCNMHSFLLCCIKLNFIVPLKHTLYWELRIDSLCSFSKPYLSLYSACIVLFSQLFQQNLWEFFWSLHVTEHFKKCFHHWQLIFQNLC